jgi:polyhydroxyalkanoate synthesis regulator phasin
MKKKHIILISCILVAGIIFSGLALADSQRTGHRKSFGFKQHHKGGGLQLLAGYQQKNLRVQVLSDMTGQSAETIQLKLKAQRMRSVMQELNIDRQAFRDAMRAKERERIKQAVSDGSITPEQEKEILVKMETHSKRRELMSKLIKKGIEDGIITQDEARMIMRKQR